MEIADRATKEPVSHLVVHEGPNFRKVEFRAADVPPVGYKVYELRAAHAAPPTSQRTTSTTIESQFYRVELDPASGSIRGIYDKELNKELVNTQSPWRFGQYLYVTGGDEEPNSILQYRAVSPKPELHPYAAKRRAVDLGGANALGLARRACVIDGKHAGDSYRNPRLQRRKEDRADRRYRKEA